MKFKQLADKLFQLVCTLLITSLFVVFSSTQAFAQGQSFTIATWNAALFINQSPSALDLQGFVNEVNFDVLLVNEIKQQRDLDEMKTGMSRNSFSTAISSFSNGNNNLEVGIISRFPLTDIVEFDQSIDGAEAGVTEVPLVRPNISGLVSRNVGRGFLVAKIPALNTFVIVSHFKSSRGRTGPSDFTNAEKREIVAAAIADEVNDLLSSNPGFTVIFGGDVNVGVRDRIKNGSNLLDDQRDGYDDTHAILGGGLVGGLRMRSLARNVGDTFTSRFFGVGAIDVLYVDGQLGTSFGDAQATSRDFGSDHLAVFATVGGMTQPPPQTPQSTIQVTNALPNPFGSDPSNEKVVIELIGANSIDISGWKLRDRADNEYVFPAGTILNPGDNELTLIQNTMPLNNDGDQILLLDSNGTQQGLLFSYSDADVEPGEFVA